VDIEQGGDPDQETPPGPVANGQESLDIALNAAHSQFLWGKMVRIISGDSTELYRDDLPEPVAGTSFSEPSSRDKRPAAV